MPGIVILLFIVKNLDFSMATRDQDILIHDEKMATARIPSAIQRPHGIDIKLLRKRHTVLTGLQKMYNVLKYSKTW